MGGNQKLKFPPPSPCIETDPRAIQIVYSIVNYSLNPQPGSPGGKIPDLQAIHFYFTLWKNLFCKWP